MKNDRRKASKARKQAARKAGRVAYAGGTVTTAAPEGPQPTTRRRVFPKYQASIAREFDGLHVDSLKKITRIRSAMRLSGPELGTLFDVSRQAIEQWADKGVPIDKMAAIDRLVEVVDGLSERFKAPRLPAVVRAPMPILDNRSILDVLRDDGPPAIFEFFRRWSSYVPGVDPIRKGEKFT